MNEVFINCRRNIAGVFLLPCFSNCQKVKVKAHRVSSHGDSVFFWILLVKQDQFDTVKGLIDDVWVADRFETILFFHSNKMSEKGRRKILIVDRRGPRRDYRGGGGFFFSLCLILWSPV